MKYPGYNRLIIKNTNYDESFKDDEDLEFIQKEYVVDFDFVSQNLIVYLDNGHIESNMNEGDLNEMSREEIDDALNLFGANHFIYEQYAAEIKIGDEYAAKHGFPKDSFRQWVIDRDEESYRRQEAEEAKLPEGQQRMMVVIDQNYLLPEGTKLTQDKYDFSNEKDIEQLKKDITTKFDKQNE